MIFFPLDGLTLVIALKVANSLSFLNICFFLRYLKIDTYVREYVTPPMEKLNYLFLESWYMSPVKRNQTIANTVNDLTRPILEKKLSLIISTPNE